MIGQAMKVDQNAKKAPQVIKKEMLIFGLCSTSDNRLSDLSNDSQLFQSFPTEVAQDNSEWPILPDSQLFQSFPTEVAQNDTEQPISMKDYTSTWTAVPSALRLPC